jgi:Spy/CpxP family protein refolding chaperone
MIAMMKRESFAIVLFLCSMSSFASAQLPPPPPEKKMPVAYIVLANGQYGFGEFGQRAGLLTVPQVADELKLTNKQRQRIANAIQSLTDERNRLRAEDEKLNEKTTEAHENLRAAISEIGIERPEGVRMLDLERLSEARAESTAATAARRESHLRLREFTRALRTKAWESVVDVLTPEQSKRLDQIEMYIQGHAALLVPAVADALGLSDVQRTELREAIRVHSIEKVSLNVRSGQQRSFNANQTFDALDADGNGDLSTTEIAGAPKAMAKFDQNSDGAISADEITIHYDNARAKLAGPDYERHEIGIAEKQAKNDRDLTIKINAIVTEEQQKKLVELKGALFTLDKAKER